MAHQSIGVVLNSTNPVEELRPLLSDLEAQFHDEALQGRVVLAHAFTDEDSEALSEWRVSQDLAHFDLVRVGRPSGYFQKFNSALTAFPELREMDLVVFMNDDVKIPEDFLMALASHPSADRALLGPIVYQYDGQIQLSCYRTRYAWWHLLLRVWDGGFYSRVAERTGLVRRSEDRLYEAVRSTVDGACFALTRGALHDIQELDGELFLWFEEVYFQKCVEDFGWECRIVPEWSIAHRGGASTRHAWKWNAWKHRTATESVLRASRHYLELGRVRTAVVQAWWALEGVMKRLRSWIRGTLSPNGS